MSFTEDELQAFNAILEQRFAAHRQEMEQALDLRLAGFRQDIAQQFVTLRQEVNHVLEQHAVDGQKKSGQGLEEQLREQQERAVQTANQEAEQRFRQVEVSVERMLAEQLQGIAQLLNQQVAKRALEVGSSMQILPPQLETIEVQTELPWEDLVAVMGKALDERLVSLDTSLQRSVKNLEQYLSARLHGLRDELVQVQGTGQPYRFPTGDGSSVQEVLSGIEHLERVMESMQVAMTANHALLSNRLYHHQQLPLERAHPTGHTHVAPANGAGSLLAQAKERVASGLEPEASAAQNGGQESAGQ